jgi:hypothetical protein
MSEALWRGERGVFCLAEGMAINSQPVVWGSDMPICLPKYGRVLISGYILGNRQNRTLPRLNPKRLKVRRLAATQFRL